jgi:hypothetical protein
MGGFSAAEGHPPPFMSSFMESFFQKRWLFEEENKSPPQLRTVDRKASKKKKGKKQFHLSLLCVRTKTKSRPLRSDIPSIHSSIQERDWVRYIFRQKFGQRQIEREKDLFFLVVLVHISTTRKKTEEEKRDLRSESLKI